MKERGKIAGLKPCRKCGGEDLEMGDCGYTTFNPGWVRCLNQDCKHEVKLSDVSADPGGGAERALTKAWNADKPSPAEENVELKKKVHGLKSQLGRAQAEIARLHKRMRKK